MATTVVKVPSSPQGIVVPVPGVGNVGIGGKGVHVPNPLDGPKKVVEGVVSAGEATVKIVDALFDVHFWIRVGEGTVGIILIIIGVNKMFGLNIGGRLASAY